MPSSQMISQFKITYMDIQILDQDIKYLYLSRLQNIKIQFNPKIHQLQKINGAFSLQHLQDGVLLFSDKVYLVKIVKLFQPKFTNVQLNTVYKFQGNTYILLQACNVLKIRINLFPPDVECTFYKDSKLENADYSVNPAQIYFLDGYQYKYLLMKSESPFYVQFRSTIHTGIEIFKPAIVYINPYRIDLRFQFNSTLMISPLNQDLTLEKLAFSNNYYDDIQIKTILCILQQNISNFQQIQENKFQIMENSKYYVFYLQTDLIVLIMQSYRLIQLSFEIEHTDIGFDLEISSLNIYQNDQICQFSNNHIIIFSQSHKFLNLSLCECQKRDCIIKLSPNESEIAIAYSVCTNIQFGLIKIQGYLFSCQQLQNIIILPITGSLNIYRKDNYLSCNDGTCSILLIDNASDLLEYQFDFILVLNQFKSFTNSPLKFLFYNNCKQLLRINTDQQYQILYQLDDLSTFLNDENNNLFDEGYYFLEFQEQISYISVFTYPTLLYQEFIYNFISSQEFTISSDCKAYALFKFIVFDKMSVVYSNLKYDVSEQYLHILCSEFSSTITIVGQGQFQVFYINNICYFKQYPYVQLLLNSSILIKFQLNQECDIEYIQLDMNDAIQLQKQCIECIISLENSNMKELSSYIRYNITIKSREYIYEHQLQSEIILLQSFNKERLHSGLLLVILLIYYIIQKIREINKVVVTTDDRSNTIDQ